VKHCVRGRRRRRKKRKRQPRKQYKDQWLSYLVKVYKLEKKINQKHKFFKICVFSVAI